jgi:hypothetical protein
MREEATKEDKRDNEIATRVQSTIEKRGRNKENSRGIDFARSTTRKQGDFRGGMCGMWAAHTARTSRNDRKHTRKKGERR